MGESLTAGKVVSRRENGSHGVKLVSGFETRFEELKVHGYLQRSLWHMTGV
jgi:hypothetical protein